MTSHLLQCGIWKSWAACEILSNCVCAETQSAALRVLVSLPKKAKLMQSEEAFPACLCQINKKPHKTFTLFSNYKTLLSFIREILRIVCKSLWRRMLILSQTSWPHFDSDKLWAFDERRESWILKRGRSSVDLQCGILKSS